MYVPEHFAENDTAALVEFARQYSFATLISVDGSMPYISHLPLLVDHGNSGAVTLTGHLAKANNHWNVLEDSAVLAVFHGPHTYISPTWYQDRGVPTWNYAAVHMSGQSELIADAADIADIVHRLSEFYEEGNPAPWVPDYAPAMLQAIIGFRISVTTLEGKFKLSQNRSVADQQGVVDALVNPFGKSPDENQSLIGAMMSRHLKP